MSPMRPARSCSTSPGARWSADVLDALEIPAAWLPPGARVARDLRPSRSLVTRCHKESRSRRARATAPLPRSGSGIDRPGPLSIVMGTSGVVFAALPAFASDPEARVHAFCHAVPGQWHAMGVMLSAAGSLQWLRDRLAPEASFADLVAEAEAWGPGVDGLLFAPYLAGERTPHADPAARAAFTGLELRHDRGALVRAVLEGVAFGLRDSLELVTALGGPVDRARASGGGARGLWLQIVASVLGRADRADRRRGRLGLRRRAARRRRRRDVRRRARRRRPLRPRPRLPWSPTPPGRPPTRRPIARFRALYPALDTVKEQRTMISLEGKVAVVTGASRGIGAAVARMLADQGVKLGLASRSGDDLGISGAVARPTDVRDRAQVTALVDETVARHGGIDIVVANAGVGAYGPFVDLDPAHHRRDDGRQRQGHDHHGRRDGAAPDRAGRRRLRLGRVRGRAARAPVRGGLLRLQVRAGRLHPRARPRAPPAGRAVHERLPRRRRDRLRDGGRATAGRPTCPSSPG